MRADSTAAPRPARLNPFAFPSDTDFRFALLIVSVLGTSLFVYNWLFHAIPLLRDPWLAAMVRCADLASAAFPDAADPIARAGKQMMEAECGAPYERTRAAWLLGGTALVLQRRALSSGCTQPGGYNGRTSRR